MSQHQTNIANLLREIVAYCREDGHEWSSLSEAEAALASPAQDQQSIDADALIRAVLPGGSSCDPQTVADEIRRYLGQWPGQASTFAEIIEAASPTPPAQQPEAVPSGLHEKDIYDFAGWLTSRPGVMEVGCTSWACPMADAVVEYIKTFPERFAPSQQPADGVVRDALEIADAIEDKTLLHRDIRNVAARTIRRLVAYPTPPAQQPAGDVVRDAERYRFLAERCRSASEHWGGRWWIVIDGPAPKSHDSEDDFDAAIDAARQREGE